MPRRHIPGQRRSHSASDQLWRKVSEPGPGAHYRGYVRFSHAAGHYGLTTEGQKQQIHAYAEARGWVCDGFDEEPARTAKYEEIERRPVFARHLEAAARGDFQVSLCYMNDRWARNKATAYVSLSRLRQAAVWWATTDGKWTIDRIEEDGWDVAYAVDVTMNAAYSRKVSEKVRIGKGTRAQLGFHNGDLMFGYARVPDPPKPLDAPSTWKAPRRAPMRHPQNFARLQHIGEWAAAGASDREIAARCNARGWLTQSSKPIGPPRAFAGEDEDGQPRFTHAYRGPRPFSKDSVRALLLNLFPRAYAPAGSPGADRGTIWTPDGERVCGQHEAAWSWELWHRIDEARTQRRGSRGHPRTDGRVWLFSGIVVCARCGNRLRADGSAYARGKPYAYYRDEAQDRGLACASVAGGWRSVRDTTLEARFVATLLAHPLPRDWRQKIADAYARQEQRTDWAAIATRRRALESELERAKFLFKQGLANERELLADSERIHQALDALPDRASEAETAARTIAAGETLESLRAYWGEAAPAERAELVRILLVPEGLRYDLTAPDGGQIVGLRPRAAFLAPLKLMLRGWRERAEQPGILWWPGWQEGWDGRTAGVAGVADETARTDAPERTERQASG